MDLMMVPAGKRQVKQRAMEVGSWSQSGDVERLCALGPYVDGRRSASGRLDKSKMDSTTNLKQRSRRNASSLNGMQPSLQ